jgi:hypothetical protein
VLRISILLAFAYCTATAPVLAQPVAGWNAAKNGVEIKVGALKREQAAAFYLARGFSADIIAPYAEACGFSFEFRNAGKTAVQVKLADWRAAGKAGGARFTLPDEWDAEWARRGTTEPARIAFRWAQFPAEQEFAPGDWIMGMAALERRIAGPFRLTLRFYDKNRQHEIAIDNVTCVSPD